MPNSDGKVKADKILEISSTHKLLAKLDNLYKEDKEMLKKYCTIMYEQARLLEGLNIEDISTFVNAISEIM